MAKKVIMPKFGMDQEEGTVSAWLKQEGDSVEKGEPILEVETDKVNMEVEAPADGILAGIKIGPGVTVPIGEVIAYILKPDEELPAEKAAATKSAAAPRAEAATLPPKTTPVAERLAHSHGLNLQTVAPPRAGERLTKADVQGYLAAQLTPSPQPAASGSGGFAGGGRAAAPAARRLARELGVDLAEVTGSGPNGRIQSRDVQQAASQPPAEAQPVAVPGQLTARRQVPLTGMRRTIAERLTASVREVPQFTVSVEVNMARAQAVVDDLRATPAAAEGP
ncbi:MAG: E3 binding domain-containing protein, partial [Anaerolineae bacterium]|nr:E3 binding domain-containing protein [Anaerolineae bacterium]